MAETLAISESEHITIEKAYDNLKKSIAHTLKGDDEKLLDKAYAMAVEGHKNQRRKSGEPYVLHPIEVARICHDEIGLGPTAIICALLHDVVEDTPVTIQEIESSFNIKVRRIVDGLTKLDGTYNTENVQAENFKKVVSTLVEDVRVVLIKMADRLHNMRTLGSMPRQKQLKIAAETAYIYTPLAHRLGLYNLKTEYQEICMQILEPDTYQDLETKLASTEKQRTKYISEFTKHITAGLDELPFKYRILGRPKSIFSIWNKIKEKKVPFEEIYDLFAIRVVLEVPRDKEKNACWQVYSVITDYYKPIPERLKDWVTTPKGNGYESLHTTVIGPGGRFVEVQIRTERMNDIAEKGFAAHWKYKGVQEHNNVYDSWLDNIRSILESQHNDATEFINDFKTNLFNEEVYVFTPNGDMKILPKGATALDFAFEIHTDIGYHATAIKINNKLVPMGYKLNNGDQVFVTTNKNQKPTENWLKMVVTGKARSKIRSAMKEERRKQGEFGMESLMRKLKNLKVDFETNVDMIVHHFGYTSRPDLYFAIAHEDFNLQELKKFHTEGNKLVVNTEKDGLVELPEEDKKVSKRRIKKWEESGKPRIIINGESADNYVFTLSSCCNPVQGDDIFAYLSSSSGMKIHRTNCPNATHLMANYGYRIMKAEWLNNSSTNFVVDLIVTGIDSGPGVIQRLTESISSHLGLNIRSFSISGDEGYFEGKISLVIANKNQLNMALKALKELEGVSSVVRLDKSTN
jgi:GTP pyrophosphokinase